MTPKSQDAVFFKMRAERDAARGALRRYGDHDLDCERAVQERATSREDAPCSCGFDAALQPPDGTEEENDG